MRNSNHRVVSDRYAAVHAGVIYAKQMINTDTPNEINERVMNFCNSISNERPIYVPVAPDADATAHNCFINVPNKIKKVGGRQVIGWAIWLWPQMYIEAEFHCVWISPDGLLIDITPKDKPTHKVFFLPDSTKKYDGQQVNNIRQAITNNGLIEDLFLVSDAIYYHTRYRNQGTGNKVTFKGEDAQIFQWLVRWKKGILKMLEKGDSRGGPCPCGSKTKYKRCCRIDFAKGISDLQQRYSFRSDANYG
jgi:hypothetical protein